MSIKIELPEEFSFSTDIPVRISDINRGGHVSWNAMAGILDEASVQFWKNLDLWEKQEVVISRIMTDACISYRKQAFHGQTLRVEMAASNLTDKGFDLVYRVSEVESGDEIARAKTSHLCYDYRKQKVIPVPARLKKKLT